MKKEIKILLEKATYARVKFHNNVITYDQAKEQITPYINAVNEAHIRIAKEFGTRPKKVSVAGFMR